VGYGRFDMNEVKKLNPKLFGDFDGKYVFSDVQKIKAEKFSIAYIVITIAILLTLIIWGTISFEKRFGFCCEAYSRPGFKYY
jgi:hypothetical protein